MKTLFRVVGPRELQTYKGIAGRTITDEEVSAFWARNHDLAERRGCYVFGMKAPRGMMPAYVGRATRTFKQEALADNKLKRYQRHLVDYRGGSPVLFFVLAPYRRGAPNARHIEQLERFLIQRALLANAKLLNVQGTRSEEWAITGVVRATKGKPSRDARQFRSLLKLV